jgi:phosphopentomutase
MARFVFMMLDGAGAGELPDAADYGDVGSNTLGNVASVMDLSLPNLRGLGLGNVIPLRNVPPVDTPQALVGRLAPKSAGKDTTVGHWEHMGLVTPRPFPTYPEGFPEEILRPFRKKIGRGILGNKPASGTAIIDELGAEHLQTGRPIVYTSADSVFQIAAHEEVIPLWELYKICETAREILRGPHEVGRVIARPFIGSPGNFSRTSNRHDYAVPPPKGMLLDRLDERGVLVHSVGKIFDVFLGRGIRDQEKTKSNTEGMAKTLEAMAQTSEGLIFVNLVDFDMLFGHRNDVEGYASALEEFDRWLPSFEAAMGPDDLAIFTADHGCDPTTASTDHSREYVPLLAFGQKARAGVDLGIRGSLSDMGQTIAENFETSIEKGTSFLAQIL